MGLVEEGKETIEEGAGKQESSADLALIIAAQKVEHYEISGYTSVRNLARQTGHENVASLLDDTLGEEETADSLLGELCTPLMAQAGSNGESGSGGGKASRSAPG